MLGFLRDQKRRLILTIGIALTFFAAELAVGFYTHSLALIADAFHYLCDLIGFIVALVAIIISERAEPAPQGYTFGWQRAKLLGAFFNGVFLLALGVSILVQAIERFVDTSPIQEPKLVLIMGCVGLGLNVVVMTFLHEHSHDHGHAHGHHHGHSHPNTPDDEHAVDGTSRHSHSHSREDNSQQASTSVEDHIEMQSPPSSPADHTGHKHRDFTGGRAGRDLGMLGVMIHVIGDAINNIGVIIAALIIWKASGPARFYADPAVGVFIAVMILLTAVPLTRSSGSILLQIAPPGVKLEDVKQDIEKIPGVESVHELHIWRLDQRKSVASAHVVVDGRTVETFADKARTIMECLHAYGIHSATLQPEAQALPTTNCSEWLSPRGHRASTWAIDNDTAAICGLNPQSRVVESLFTETHAPGGDVKDAALHVYSTSLDLGKDWLRAKSDTGAGAEPMAVKETISVA